VAITADNFQQIIIEKSKEQLVLVDFFAEQIPESMQLKQMLEGIAQANPQAFLLATVDCQTEQMIAAQFGIQALPTLVLLKDAQPIDMLAGPQDELAIKAFLEKHLPKEEDKLYRQASDLLKNGQLNDAFTPALNAYQLDSERADIKLLLADIYLQLGKSSEAQPLLDAIKMVDQDSYYQSLMSKLELANAAAHSPELVALEQEFAADPQNTELKRKLAVQYSQANRQQEALDLLLESLKADLGDNDSKVLLLDILKTLPNGDPLAAKYRRKLYTLMY
jgi:putative thioredoxin